MIKTSVQLPRANSFAGRFETLRRECLDHVLILGERHLRKILAGYAQHYNDHRPHQACRRNLRCARPATPAISPPRSSADRSRRPDSEYGIVALASTKSQISGYKRVLARHRLAIPVQAVLRFQLCPATHVTCFAHTSAVDLSGVSCRGWWSRPDSDAGYPQYGGHMATVLDLSYWIRWGSASAVRSVSPRPGTPGSGRMTPPTGSSVPSKNSDSIRT